MEAVPDKELENQLVEAGKELLNPPSALNELLDFLDRIETYLSKVDQSPCVSMQNALQDTIKGLVDERLLQHSDTDVQAAVASCISEITRITAPEAPYNDNQMKDIFQLIVSTFGKLFDTSSRSYQKRVLILETVAKVRSCVVMLDLECDALILEMFQHFLKAIRDNHSDKVFSSMETIMTLVLDESEEIPLELLSPLLKTIKNDNQDVLPIAKNLADKVLQNSAAKLKPYVMQAMKSFGTSVHDYSKVVASICQEALSLPEEQKVDQQIPPEQVPAELNPIVASPGVGNSVVESNATSEIFNTETSGPNTNTVIAKSETNVPNMNSNIINTENKEDDIGKENVNQKPIASVHSVEASDSSRTETDKEAGEHAEESKSRSGEANNSASQDLPVVRATVPSEEEKISTQQTSFTVSHNEPVKASLASSSRSLPGTRSKKGRRQKKKSNSKQGTDLGLSSATKSRNSNDPKQTDNEPPPSPDVISKTESERIIDSEEKENAHSGGKEKASEEQTSHHVDDILMKKSDPAVETEEKPLRRSGKKVKVKVDKTPHHVGDNCMESNAASESEEKPLRRSGIKLNVKGVKTPDHVGDISRKESDPASESEEKPLRRSVKKVKVKQDKTPQHVDDISTKESNPASGTEEKPLKQSGKKVKVKEDKTPHLVGDILTKGCDPASGSEEKPLRQSGKKAVEKTSEEDEVSLEQEVIKKKGRRENKSKDVTREPSSMDKVYSPRATQSSNKDKSNMEETPNAKTKRKRTPGKEMDSKTPNSGSNNGEELVGSKIRVWWPHDKTFYEGTIDSFDPIKKKHKVSYIDGEVEVLNLRRERWQYVEEDTGPEKAEDTEHPSSDSSDMPLKKIQADLVSSTSKTKRNSSAKRGRGSSTGKSMPTSSQISKGSAGKPKDVVSDKPTGDSSKSGRKRKKAEAQTSKSEDDDKASTEPKEQNAESSEEDKSKNDAPKSGKKHKRGESQNRGRNVKDDGPSTESKDQVAKVNDKKDDKDGTPETSSKIKDFLKKRRVKINDKEDGTPKTSSSKPKSGVTPDTKTNNKSNGESSAAKKRKLLSEVLQESKDSSSKGKSAKVEESKTSQPENKAEETEKISGRKRSRKASRS